jgi:hypothetical protein
MRYECDALECHHVRGTHVQRVLRGFNEGTLAATGQPSPLLTHEGQNKSAIGFLMYSDAHDKTLHVYAESCFPQSIFDRSAPWWLRAVRGHPDLRNESRRCLEEGQLPHDACVAAYLRFVHRIDVRILTCNEHSCLEGADQVGTIIIRQAPADVTLRQGAQGDQLRDVCYALLHSLHAQGVRLYPDLEHLEMNYAKRQHYRHLQRAGVPFAPFVPWVHPTSSHEIARRLLRTGWASIIAKPAWQYDTFCGFGSSGITKIDLLGSDDKPRSELELSAELTQLAEQCLSLDHVDFTLQQFVPTLAQNYEIRVFRIGGLYSHALATRMATQHVVGIGYQQRFELDTFTDELAALHEGVFLGNLSQDIKNRVVDLSKRAMLALPFEPTSMPLLRVDVACCLEEKWFVNEMTWFPDLMINRDGAPGQTIKRVAEAYLGFARSAWAAH